MQKIKWMLILVSFLCLNSVFTFPVFAGPGALTGHVYVKDPVTGISYGLDGVTVRKQGNGGIPTNGWCKSPDESIEVITSNSAGSFITDLNSWGILKCGVDCILYQGWNNDPGKYAFSGGVDIMENNHVDENTLIAIFAMNPGSVQDNNNPAMCHTNQNNLKECGLNCGCNEETVSVLAPTTLPAALAKYPLNGHWEVSQQNGFSCSNTNPTNTCTFSLGNNAVGVLDFTYILDVQPLTLTGRTFCQDGTENAHPVANAPVTVTKGGTNQTVTTDASGNFSISALTSDAPFAVAISQLPSGNLDNGQPYSALQGPTAINCNNTLTTCTATPTGQAICSADQKAYQNCTLATGSHGNFDFKYTNCTPKVYACTAISPDSPTPQRGSSLTFGCQGSGNDAHTADFRINGPNGETASVSNIALNASLAAQWQYTVLQSAASGTYTVQCRICNTNNQCTTWGKAQ